MKARVFLEEALLRPHFKENVKARPFENITHAAIQKSNIKQTMHASVKFIIILAQCFALLPVDGVAEKRATSLRFTWWSLRMLYTFLSFAGTLFLVSMGFYHLFLDGSMFERIVEHIFYVSGICTIVLFVRLAKDWPQLMVEWTKVDMAMEKNYGYPKGLDRRLKITAVVVMVLALVEHKLSLGFHVGETVRRFGGAAFNASTYYTHVYPQVFGHIPYSPWIAGLVQTVSILSTFTWTYNNLFIMLVSSALAVRFKQITIRLAQHENKIFSHEFWREIREDYDRLCNLCKLLDSSLSVIVLLSFATNLFFILVQLFNSLRIITDPVEKVYFFYSFAFLILRTIAVSLYAAWVNDESKEPANYLHSVSSEVFNNEIRRFLMQISFDDAALTGSKMFKVTRGLILNVAGAIVTYELVLIQFSNNNLQATS